MKRLLPACLCLLISISLSSCGKPTHDSLTEDMMTQMEDMTKVLNEVDDEDSAKAAAKEIDKISKKMAKIKEQMEEIGDPSKEVEAKLKEKYGERMDKVMKDYMAALMKFAMKPELNKHMKESMENFGEALN